MEEDKRYSFHPLTAGIVEEFAVILQMRQESSLLSSRTLTFSSNSPMCDIEELILDERRGGIGDI